MRLAEDATKTDNKLLPSYHEFWKWFASQAGAFHEIVKQGDHIEEEFFNELGPRLDAVKEGFWYVTGMYDEDTAELIITADGDLKQIAFVEELVSLAPQLKGWRFTALKPSLDIENVAIELDGCLFNAENLSFYANDHSEYPDEIDISVVHHDYKEEERETIITGIYLFLDNYLGELDAVTLLDNVEVVAKQQAEQELIPIEKLKDYLHWRQKEFLERYEGVWHDTENDTYASLEAKLKSGESLVATVNKDLLRWDSKASHPWIVVIKIPYKDNNDGMPDADTYQQLEALEVRVQDALQDATGYLNVGRQTGQRLREIFFACKDFREPSRVLCSVQREYTAVFELDFDIYKDKYWMSLDRFRVDEM